MKKILPMALLNLVSTSIFVALRWSPGPTKWGILAATTACVAGLALAGALRRRAHRSASAGAALPPREEASWTRS